MAEPTQDTGARPGPATMEDRGFLEIVKALVGKPVTIINPESYEAAPVGYKITEGFYRGKVTGLGRDYLVMMTEFERKKTGKEPIKQYIPLSRIKRVTVMKAETLLHL